MITDIDFLTKNTMSRTFAYARVSTIEQETENQIAEIKAAGFALEQQRTIAEMNFVPFSGHFAY
jgi:predicted site-specific integrase-resolvase